MLQNNVRSAIVGESRHMTVMNAGIAILIGVLSFIFFSATPILNITLPVNFYIGVLAVMFIAAIIQSYLNIGFLVSIFLAVTPALGYFAAISVFRLGGPVHTTLLEAIGLSLMFGIPVGVLGFIIGGSLKLLKNRISISN